MESGMIVGETSQAGEPRPLAVRIEWKHGERTGILSPCQVVFRKRLAVKDQETSQGCGGKVRVGAAPKAASQSNGNRYAPGLFGSGSIST